MYTFLYFTNSSQILQKNICILSDSSISISVNDLFTENYQIDKILSTLPPNSSDVFPRTFNSSLLISIGVCERA